MLLERATRREILDWGLIIMKACCANPNPQLMYDTHLGKAVLQCMNCGAFC